jgi:hypothetical protein
MPRSILLIVLLAATMAVSAQTYKWKDASGATQYSDTPPPPGAKDVQQLGRVPGPPTPAASAGTAPKTYADRDAEFRKRQTEKQEADAKRAKAQEDEQIRSRHCEQAKTHLAALEAGARVTRYNDKGERVVLDDAGREGAKAEAQKAIDTWCK